MSYVTVLPHYSRKILLLNPLSHLTDMSSLASIRLAFLTTVFAGLTSTALADVYTGRVVAVADGDTVTVLDTAKVQRKVRLAGIDAPDMQVPSKKS